MESSGSRPAMAEHCGRILHVAARKVRYDRANWRRRHQPIARDAAISGRDADDAAEDGGLADGAAGIGAERHHGGTLRDCCRRTAARSTGNAIERLGLRTGPKAEFSLDEPMANSSQLVLPRIMAPCCFEAGDGGGIVGRNVVLEHPRAAGGADALGDDDIFHAQRNASQCAELAPSAIC